MVEKNPERPVEDKVQSDHELEQKAQSLEDLRAHLESLQTQIRGFKSSLTKYLAGKKNYTLQNIQTSAVSILYTIASVEERMEKMGNRVNNEHTKNLQKCKNSFEEGLQRLAVNNIKITLPVDD